MSNRNFDSRVIIQRLQNQNYARNLYLNTTGGRGIINNPQNSDGDASRYNSYIPGAQTEYFRGLLGGGETISVGGIVNIPPFLPTSVATPAPGPTVPTAPTITLITGDSCQLTVVFIPGSDGGSSITNYEYSIDNGSTFTSAGTTSSPILITGLLNGITYSVVIRAINLVGAGAVSNVENGTPVYQYGGSMYFDYNYGTQGSYVKYPNNSGLTIGTQSFTIELYQYLQTDRLFSVVFAIGRAYTSSNIIELQYDTNKLYLSYQQNDNIILNDITPLKNKWTHIAIVGDSGNNINIYIDGNLQTTIGSYNIPNNTSLTLTIGNETTPIRNLNYTGYITNFRWVTGTAVYDTNFIPPTAPLTSIPGTQLLLLSSDNSSVVTDSSSTPRAATNIGVIYSAMTPLC